MSNIHEYQLQISDKLFGRKLSFQDFPDLDVVYVSSQNNLCPSNYSDAMCIWEGDLDVVLQVNGEQVMLNDHDSNSNTNRTVRVAGYEFQGLRPLVKNRSINHTYLIFSIKKLESRNPITLRNNIAPRNIINTSNNYITPWNTSNNYVTSRNTINTRNIINTNNINSKNTIMSKNSVKTYNLNQPFILEFGDNPSTGYSWTAKTTPGLEIISNTYSNKCEPGLTGCGGIRTFVLKGTMRGKQIFTGTYGRPWAPETMIPENYEFNIV